MVDLGGSLVLASRGLYSTGVSTDLNVTYLNSGGKVGDVIRAEAVCDKCKCFTVQGSVACELLMAVCSWQNVGIYFSEIH